MKKIVRIALVSALIGCLEWGVSAISEEAFKGIDVLASWQRQEDFQEFNLMVDSEFSLMPGAQLRTEFNHLSWKEQRITRLELGPYWKDVVFESAGERNFLEFDSIGMGMTLSWADQVSSIPLAFVIPRQGFFCMISGEKCTDTKSIEVEGFAKLKNYYFEDSAGGFEAEGGVWIKPFCFYLAGLKFWKSDLLSQFIQMKIEFLKPISVHSSISCILGIEINEVVYSQNLDEGYQHFLSENWFGEALFKSQGNLLAFGLKFDEGRFCPYIRMLIGLLL